MNGVRTSGPATYSTPAKQTMVLCLVTGLCSLVAGFAAGWSSAHKEEEPTPIPLEAKMRILPMPPDEPASVSVVVPVPAKGTPAADTLTGATLP